MPPFLAFYVGAVGAEEPNPGLRAFHGEPSPQPQFYVNAEIHRDLTCLSKTSESFSQLNKTKQTSKQKTKER